MKFILYLMLFSTPAATITDKADKICLQRQTMKEINEIVTCRPKFEAHHVWSLQTASQMEFSQFQSCFGTLDQLMVDSNVASTMTLRAWCLCDDPDKKCPSETKMEALLGDLRVCEKE